MPRAPKPPPGALDVALGAVLWDLLNKAQMSQRSLATSAGLNQSQLSKYMRGEVSFNVVELDAVCHALGRSVTEVIDAAEYASSQRWS